MTFKKWKCKWIVGAFLAGELVSLFYKDQTFRWRFAAKSNLVDKGKVILNGLVDLNKRLFLDVKTYDYQGTYDDVKQFVEREKDILDDKVEDLKSKMDDLSEDKIQPLIAELENKLETIKEKVSNSVDQVNEKYNLDKKIKQMETKIKWLKDKVASSK